MAHVTADVCTKDRYLTTLPLTLVSIANQTRKPDYVIIYDDSSEPIDIGANETLRYVFQMFDSKGIKWRHIWGQKRGQHIGHQFIQEQATEFVWRIDDDEIAEPNTLQVLLSNFFEDGDETEDELMNVGAVGGLVLLPGAHTEEPRQNTIIDAMANKNYNCQWHFWKHPKPTMPVEHIYSSYLYRKGIQKYNKFLSPVAHREETLHSYGILKQGYRLIVDSRAVTWHLRSSTGGIRTGSGGNFNNDEIMFKGIMREYGIGCQKEKNFLLNEGMGDHVVFSTLVPKILDKYKDFKINFYVTFPEVFRKYKLNLFSIAQGEDALGDKERFNVYEYMHQSGKKENIENAYRSFYDI